MCRDREYAEIKSIIDECSLKHAEHFFSLKHDQSGQIQSGLTFDDGQRHFDSIRELTAKIGYENGILIQIKFDEFSDENKGLDFLTKFLSFVSHDFTSRSIKWLLIGDQECKKSGVSEIWRNNLGKLSLRILKTIILDDETTPVRIARKLDLSQPHVSKALRHLRQKKLVSVTNVGNRRIYTPSLYIKGAIENGI